MMGEPAGFGVIERFDPRFDEVIPLDAVLERVAEGIEWGEGPLWDPRDGSLLFSDIPRNRIFRWTPGGGVTLAIDRSGYTGSDPFKGREPGSNGLTFDAAGRLTKELSFYGVYRLTPDGELSVQVPHLSAPNGVAFSPDEKTLYVSNSDPDRPVWMAYTVESDGTLSIGREFANASPWMGEGAGLPDGLKVGAGGHVFATGPGGIHVFAPDGTRIGRIQTGVPTGNLNWGEDGSVLYITANH